MEKIPIRKALRQHFLNTFYITQAMSHTSYFLLSVFTSSALTVEVAIAGTARTPANIWRVGAVGEHIGEGADFCIYLL